MEIEIMELQNKLESCHKQLRQSKDIVDSKQRDFQDIQHTYLEQIKHIQEL